jgi:N-acetylmuramoyl-L-alanine amidase
MIRVFGNPAMRSGDVSTESSGPGRAGSGGTNGYHESLRLQHAPLPRRLALLALAGLIAGGTPVTRALRAGQDQNRYTIYSSDSRRELPFEAGATHTVALDELAALFQFTVREELLVEGQVGGLAITTTGQRILLIPGQSWAQVSGEVRSLSGQVAGERGAWRVPVDFLSRALGPAIGVPIEVRRDSRLIVVGDIRVPAVSGRLDQLDDVGRLVLDVRPATPHTVTRSDDRLTIRFEAEALDLGEIAGSAPDFVRSTQVIGSALVVELGPLATSFTADEDQDDSRLAIDLGSPAAPEPAAPVAGEPPVVDLARPGVIRTVIIDPGHGGFDEGARGPGGAVEKAVTLQVAQQLKAAIESRMGLRVVLTRDGDDAVPLERRSALANNNKADLFISLHANASMNPAVAGVQVASLSVEDYAARAPSLPSNSGEVTFLGGDTRLVEAVPWDLAQLPHADRSAAIAAILVRRLREQGVPMLEAEAARLPIRVLVGANMPAVQIEIGFLSNPEEERAVRTGDRRVAIVEALVGMIAEVRHGIPETSPEGPPR